MLDRYFLTGKNDRWVRQVRFVRRRFWVRWIILLLFMLMSFILCVQVGAQEEPKLIAQEWQIRGIEAALEDDRPGVWEETLGTLLNYEPQSIQSLVKPDTVQNIGNILQDKQQEGYGRGYAALALGYFGDAAKNYIPEIAAILQDKQQDSLMRGYAALALSNFGDAAKNYIPEIAAILQDKQQNSFMRGYAALALSNFGDAAENYIPEIAAILQDKQQNSLMRGYAATALGYFGDAAENYIPEIAAILQDKQQDSDVRRDAALALGNFGDAAKNYIPEIAAILQDKQQNSLMRGDAATALGYFGDAAKNYIPEILDFIKDKQREGYGRSYAARALGKITKLNFDQILLILSPVYEEAVDADAWRFYAYFLSGGDEDIKRLLQWIAKPKQLPAQLNHDEGVKTLEVFRKAWDASKDLPEIRNDLANATARVAKNVTWRLQDLPLLQQHYNNLKASGFTNADSVQTAIIASLGVWNLLSILRTGFLIHIVFWLALIFAYPKSPQIQALFFWNPGVRKIAGLLYVNYLLATVPFLQHKLLTPFQADLRKAAGLEQFDPRVYFQESEVEIISWEAGQEKKTTQSLTEVIPKLKGQIILQAPSGFGKTMFLRYLINQSPHRTIVFLTATECAQAKDHDVIQAIQSKLLIADSDPDFLKSLIYSGTVDICIDGLNEINAEAQACIKQFLSSYTKGNIILTTQPLSDKNPPQSAQLYRLLPLKDEQIYRFLTSRQPENAILQDEDYRRVCNDYLKQVLDPSQSPEDLEAIRRVLSNPMDLDTVADMLANQQSPDLFHLQKQLYDQMAADYANTNNGFNFPLKPLAQLAYEMRMKDKNLVSSGELDQEAIDTLEKHKLLTPKSGSWQFRHDKIWEFFIVQKYLEDQQAAYEELREHERISDTRLRGVYLQLAIELKLPIANSLEKALFDYASSTGDHNTSDPFRKRLESRHQSPSVLSPGNPMIIPGSRS